jgi:hypothetical protein
LGRLAALCTAGWMLRVPRKGGGEVGASKLSAGLKIQVSVCSALPCTADLSLYPHSRPCPPVSSLPVPVFLQLHLSSPRKVFCQSRQAHAPRCHKAFSNQLVLERVAAGTFSPCKMFFILPRRRFRITALYIPSPLQYSQSDILGVCRRSRVGTQC